MLGQHITKRRRGAPIHARHRFDRSADQPHTTGRCPGRPVVYSHQEMGDDMTIVLGSDRTGRVLEVGVLDIDDTTR